MNDEFEFPAGTRFEIRYQSLFRAGSSLAFPCDAQGHVDLDALSRIAKENYLFARAMVGRDFAFPQVEAVESGPSLPRG